MPSTKRGKEIRETFSKWLWICPYPDCNNSSNFPNTHHRAAAIGRIHCKRLHKIYLEPILVKIK